MGNTTSSSAEQSVGTLENVKDTIQTVESSQSTNDSNFPVSSSENLIKPCSDEKVETTETSQLLENKSETTGPNSNEINNESKEQTLLFNSENDRKIDSPHDLLKSSTGHEKIEHISNLSGPAPIPNWLKLFPKLNETTVPLFVISTDHIVGYVESLDAAKDWIENHISKNVKTSFPSNLEFKRNEYDSEDDNLVYIVTIYEKVPNTLTSRSVIVAQYHVWNAVRLYGTF
jgi:hypothetical protein